MIQRVSSPGSAPTFDGYYPEPVRLRRIAHWCRYISGMGAYALKRAILRDNDYYANVTFTRAIRLTMQLAFLLEKTYFPYDKWTYAYFIQLPRLAEPMQPLVDEAVKLSTGWERKLELLHEMSDVLDQFLVADGIIAPTRSFRPRPRPAIVCSNMPTPRSSRACPTNSRASSPSGTRSTSSHFTVVSWTASRSTPGTRCCS